MSRGNGMTLDAMLGALTSTKGDVAEAARMSGVRLATFQQRMHRLGVTRNHLAFIRLGRELPAPVAPGDAYLGDERVTLRLADYALLRERAEMASEAERLAADLRCANRIIDSLTRELSERAA